jgi:dynein heavy chain, axonemal
MDAAVASLKSLNKNDITEVKAMSNPSNSVKMVMEAVCIMFGVKTKMVAGEKVGSKVADYWPVCGPLLASPQKFLDSLFGFYKDNIADAVIQKIQPYIESEDFTPAAISKVSKVCTSICTWVRAMHKYHFVARAVEPKRQALKEADKSLQVTLQQLADAKQAVNDRLADMEAKFASLVAKKKQLEDKAQECELKLLRAEKLISLLGDERVRWQVSVETFDNLIRSVVGDIVVSAGTVAYKGPFRAALSTRWRAKRAGLGVPHTLGCDLITTLGEPVQIRDWQISVT